MGVDFIKANLACANLSKANLKWTNLREANLREAHYLTFDRLSKVKILHDTKLDEKLLNPLRKEYGSLLKGKYSHQFRDP